MKTTYQNSRMVRKPEFSLQQIIRRLSEQVFIKKDAISYLVLKGAHMDGPLLDSLINGVITVQECVNSKIQSESKWKR